MRASLIVIFLISFVIFASATVSSPKYARDAAPRLSTRQNNTFPDVVKWADFSVPSPTMIISARPVTWTNQGTVTPFIFMHVATNSSMTSGYLISMFPDNSNLGQNNNWKIQSPLPTASSSWVLIDVSANAKWVAAVDGASRDTFALFLNDPALNQFGTFTLSQTITWTNQTLSWMSFSYDENTLVVTGTLTSNGNNHTLPFSIYRFDGTTQQWTNQTSSISFTSSSSNPTFLISGITAGDETSILFNLNGTYQMWSVLANNSVMPNVPGLATAKHARLLDLNASQPTTLYCYSSSASGLVELQASLFNGDVFTPWLNQSFPFSTKDLPANTWPYTFAFGHLIVVPTLGNAASLQVPSLQLWTHTGMLDNSSYTWSGAVFPYTSMTSAYSVLQAAASNPFTYSAIEASVDMRWLLAFDSTNSKITQFVEFPAYPTMVSGGVPEAPAVNLVNLVHSGATFTWNPPFSYGQPLTYYQTSTVNVANGTSTIVPGTNYKLETSYPNCKPSSYGNCINFQSVCLNVSSTANDSQTSFQLGVVAASGVGQGPAGNASIKVNTSENANPSSFDIQLNYYSIDGKTKTSAVLPDFEFYNDITVTLDNTEFTFTKSNTNGSSTVCVGFVQLDFIAGVDRPVGAQCLTGASLEIPYIISLNNQTISITSFVANQTKPICSFWKQGGGGKGGKNGPSGGIIFLIVVIVIIAVAAVGGGGFYLFQRMRKNRYTSLN